MKDMIISKEVKDEEKMLSENIMDTTALAEVAQVLSFNDLARRYQQVINNADLNIVKELELTGIKKYERRASQDEIKLDWLHDQIFTLIIFVKYLYRMYNNEKVAQNINSRQNIDPEWVLFFFI